MRLDQFTELEQRAGGPGNAAKVLGVAYNGSYCHYKASGKVPRYIERSIAAHLALSKREFKRLKTIATS